MIDFVNEFSTVKAHDQYLVDAKKYIITNRQLNRLMTSKVSTSYSYFCSLSSRCMCFYRASAC